MMEWPENWEEILHKMPDCHRCGSRFMPKLYCLSEQFHDILVCRLCSNAYHRHIKKFVDEIIERRKLRITCNTENEI